jgi:hypothetical protein
MEESVSHARVQEQVRSPALFVKAPDKTKGSNAHSAMAGGFKNVAHAMELAAPVNHNRTYAGHAKDLVQAHSPALNAKARDSTETSNARSATDAD